MPGAVVIGVGPGIGRSVGLRFAREGLAVALIGRTGATARAIAGEIGRSALPLTADSTDETALRGALDAAAEAFGPPDIVVYNAAVIRADRIGELSSLAHQQAWAVNVVGAITTAAHVLPGMAGRGHGTFIVTGGLPEPSPDRVSLSLGKAGVRALVTLLDEEYARSGVHVATVTVAGAAVDPQDIADDYWRLHVQPRDRWETEVVHDRIRPVSGPPQGD